MDYLETFEPLHEWDPDELEHILNEIWSDLELIFTHEEFSPKVVEEIGRSASSMLKILIYTLKKSLIYFYPGRTQEILEIANVNEATKYKYLLLTSRQYFTPLNEGADALVKIYAELVPCGNHLRHLPLSEEEMEQRKGDFNKMNLAVKNYLILAKQFYHNRKMKEARPLIEGGETRKKQLSAHRYKKNPAIMKASKKLFMEKRSNTANELLLRFPLRDNPLVVDGCTIFRENTEEGEEKIFCIAPSGKVHPVGKRAFANYYKKIKDEISMNDNS